MDKMYVLISYTIGVLFGGVVGMLIAFDISKNNNEVQNDKTKKS